MMPRVEKRKRGLQDGLSLQTFGDVWDLVAVAFLPFSLGLWMSIFVVLVSTSVIYYFVERPRGHERGGVGMGPSIYQMLASFASFNSNFEPKTLSGRILVLGVTIFLAVLGASFTANTATFLVRAMDIQGVQFTDVASVARASKKLCVYATAVPLLRQRYPGLNHETIKSSVGKTNSAYAIDDVPDLLSKGICDGAVLSEKDITEMWAMGDICDYEYVGDAVFQYYIGFFASQRVVEGLTFAARSLDETGVFDSIASGINRGVVSSHSCNNKVAHEDDYSGGTQLDISHMAGCISLVVIFCILSLFTNCLRSHADYELIEEYGNRVERYTGIDFDGDGHVGHHSRSLSGRGARRT